MRRPRSASAINIELRAIRTILGYLRKLGLLPHIDTDDLKDGIERFAVTATCLEDLGGLPGNKLEALKRDRKGRHSIRINDQWRLCFRWQKTDAFDVEIVDYH